MTSAIFDYQGWNSRAAALSREFMAASPYPHLVLDNFLDEAKLEAALKSFPDRNLDNWIQYTHVNERKLGQNNRALIPSPCMEIIDELNAAPFLRFLEAVSGITGLLPDPSLHGGGLHQVKKGGFLNIHADFTSHPYKRNWARRLNVLIYLNTDWKEEYGGHFEFWDRGAGRCVKRVLPVFNRCVVFKTDLTSFHGHPHALDCPDGRTRKAIALYYFVEEKGRVVARSTEYKPLPTDQIGKKLAILIDNFALRIFDFSKRKFGLTDRWAGSILRWLFK